MFNIDLSKTIPRDALAHMSALIPGFFLEISILLGKPQLLSRYLDKAQSALPLSPYLELAIALFLAFIIGTAFMLFVGFVQHVLTYFHRFRVIIEEELIRWPIVPLFNRLSRVQFFISRHRFRKLRDAAFDRLGQPDEGNRLASAAWNRLAQKFLKDRYGIELGKLGDEAEYLFWSMGTPTAQEWRGPLLAIAAEATGWAGIVAMRLAPHLRNGYYLALCLLFILTGLHNDYYAAGRRADPVASVMQRIRALLKQYEQQRTPGSGSPEAPENTGDAEPH